jgi:hypothetical protein
MRTVTLYEVFIKTIKDQLIGRIDDPVIVVASDEQQFIKTITSKLSKVKSYETLRHEEGEAIYGKGPLGYGMPSFISKDQKEALKGAVMDYLIICQSNVLIHNLGSLSNAALLTNPSIKNIEIV